MTVQESIPDYRLREPTLVDAIAQCKAAVAKTYTHVIYDVFLSVLLPCALVVGRTNDVDLIVVKLVVISVHINDVVRVVYPESETE